MTSLVIVESPTKARTIEDFLPDGYTVMASMGHVRDLPSSASEIPKSARGESWSRLGVDVENGFKPLYVVNTKRRATIKELKAALKDADELIIATDEDREGESIGWHLVEVLQPKVPVKRMVFHEITEEAIHDAVRTARSIDDDLVRAQETRRILDRLVGYTLSPLLWKKIAPKLSAGRVQSVAVRLLVERERERHAFVRGSYWDLDASLAEPDDHDSPFTARLLSVGGSPVARGRDFDESTGQVPAGSDVLVLDEDEAVALRDRLVDSDWRVTSVEKKRSVRRPYPPFTTSTMQQESGRKLRLSARETMRTAQRLYENGYITYHRTDSVHLSAEAISGTRRRVEERYGAEYLSKQPRRYKTKSRTAQEAHEAIRPAGGLMRPASELPLQGNEARLYDLIWKRTMATQMADAQLEHVTALIEADDAVFRARGRQVLFPGFFRAYVEGSDDPDAAIEDRDEPLPELNDGDDLDLLSLEPVGHETKPPARYTEAALVKALEANGVGRPSTYATIIGTIVDRGYVKRLSGALVPTFTAFAVTGLLESDFDQLVDIGFTAGMEEDLDGIAAGEVDPQDYLETFYLGESGLESQVEAATQNVDARQASTVSLGDVSVRIGRYGPFLERGEGDDRVTAAVPDEMAPGDLSSDAAHELLSRGAEVPEALGADPQSGEQIYLKDGPFGHYVQLGDGDGDAKPKRVSVPKNLAPADVDLPTAQALLALPRDLGLHPDDQKPVKAGIGRYGPYVVHDGVYASLRKDDDVLQVDLDRALLLLAEKAARKGRGRGGRREPTVLKELGTHPETGEQINVLDGRYGPYVRHGGLNASLPKDMSPNDATLELALELLSARAARGGPVKRTRRKKS
ncbi:MAG: type I DNA topoisomerase [Anaerolineae bacterium]